MINRFLSYLLSLIEARFPHDPKALPSDQCRKEITVEEYYSLDGGPELRARLWYIVTMDVTAVNFYRQREALRCIAVK